MVSILVGTSNVTGKPIPRGIFYQRSPRRAASPAGLAFLRKPAPKHTPGNETVNRRVERLERRTPFAKELFLFSTSGRKRRRFVAV